MRVVIEVSPAELEEMKVNVDELKANIIHDLKEGDYSGFNVDIVCVDPASSKVTLSRVIDHIRTFESL